MVAKTDQKARLLDLMTSVLELARDGKRKSDEVCDVLQVIKDRKDFVEKLLAPKAPASVPTKATPSVRSLLRDWQKFFAKYFPNLKVDLSNLQIPEKKEGFDRLIIVPQGLTPNLVYTAMCQQFKCWKYTDNLDSITSDRNPTQAYAIWLRNRVEADEELKNLSANQLKEKAISGITLLERLLYELKFWDENHTHLDIQSITLCSSSRGPDGFVPCVCWDDSKLRVRWCGRFSAYEDLRVRVVVS